MKLFEIYLQIKLLESYLRGIEEIVVMLQLYGKSKVLDSFVLTHCVFPSEAGAKGKGGKDSGKGKVTKGQGSGNAPEGQGNGNPPAMCPACNFFYFFESYWNYLRDISELLD